jgi:hypothetical protein
MKERLPAETVFEQIPHIRSQLAAAAEKMRDSFKPAPPKKPTSGAPAPSPTKTATAGAAVMASTKGELSTPVARAKSVTGSIPTAAPVAAAASSASAARDAKAAESEEVPASIPNAAVGQPRQKRKRSGPPRHVCKAIHPARRWRELKFRRATNRRLHPRWLRRRRNHRPYRRPRRR